MTITEALAEIKTIFKRIETKKNSIGQYMYRLENQKDPLEKDGGSAEFIQRELQAISDLEERVVALRRAIAEANCNTTIEVDGVKRTIEDWLIWRREIASGRGGR